MFTCYFQFDLYSRKVGFYLLIDSLYELISNTYGEFLVVYIYAGVGVVFSFS